MCVRVPRLFFYHNHPELLVICGYIEAPCPSHYFKSIAVRAKSNAEDARESVNDCRA